MSSTTSGSVATFSFHRAYSIRTFQLFRAKRKKQSSSNCSVSLYFYCHHIYSINLVKSTNGEKHVLNRVAGTTDNEYRLGKESDLKNASFILSRGLFSSAEWKILDYRPVYFILFLF